MFKRENPLVYTLMPPHDREIASASVTLFNALAPFDQAAEPDNQNIARHVVNMKSYRKKSKYSLVSMSFWYGFHVPTYRQWNFRLWCVYLVKDGIYNGNEYAI